MITFDPEMTEDGFRRTLGGLVNLAVNGRFTNDGFPSERIIILRVEDDGIVICEQDDDGNAIDNSTWHIGWDEIVSIHVP